MNGLEHGWVADGSTGAADEEYVCFICDALLGYENPEHEDDDGNPLCEACWEMLLDDQEEDDV